MMISVFVEAVSVDQLLETWSRTLCGPRLCVQPLLSQLLGWVSSDASKCKMVENINVKADGGGGGGLQIHFEPLQN